MRANINPAALVEIGSVAVDKDLPQKERYAEYKRQVKDTEHYKSKQFSITAIHPNNGVRLEDCLRGMLEY